MKFLAIPSCSLLLSAKIVSDFNVVGLFELVSSIASTSFAFSVGMSSSTVSVTSITVGSSLASTFSLAALGLAALRAGRRTLGPLASFFSSTLMNCTAQFLNRCKQLFLGPFQLILF